MQHRLPLFISALVLAMTGAMVPEASAAGSSAPAAQAGPSLAAQKPNGPTNILVRADKSNHRKCRATWTPPAQDVGKNPVDPKTLTYNVYLIDFKSTRHPIAKNYAETSIDIEYTEQGFNVFQVLVEAVNSAGTSAAVRSGQRIFLGDSSTGEFAESWANGRASQPVLQGFEEGNGTWYATAEARYDFTGCDNDHGYTSAVSYRSGSKAIMFTNYMDLSKVENPIFSYHVFKFPHKCDLKVDVLYVVDSVETILDSYNVKDLPLMDWNSKCVNLNNCKNRVGQVGLRITWNEANQYFFADNFFIGTPPANDMLIGYLQVPKTMKVGMPENVTATVTNRSGTASSPYTVNLMRDGVKVASKQMPSLAPFASTKVSICETLTLAFPDSVMQYTMTLDAPGDTLTANNTTNTFATATTASTLPPVRSLVSNDQNSVDIAWQAPDLDKLPVDQRLEDFESYDSWQGANLGDWTNIDGDGLNVKGFTSNGQAMPVTGKQAYFIYDCDQFSNLYGTSRPGTGHRFPITLYTNGGESNDWLISPELNGCPQVIEFSSMGYFNFKCQWEVYYSTTGKDTTDMRLLQVGSDNRNIWHKFRYALPDGSKYFALRTKLKGPSTTPPLSCYDDFAFIPAGKGQGTLKGYNIYCDGTLLTPTPLTTTSYKAPKSTTSSNVYKITAVYDRGESRPVTIDINSGVSAIDNALIDVTADYGRILVSVPSDMTCRVYTLQGNIVSEPRLSAGANSIELQAGVYILTLNGRAYKLAVK